MSPSGSDRSRNVYNNSYLVISVNNFRQKIRTVFDIYSLFLMRWFYLHKEGQREGVKEKKKKNPVPLLFSPVCVGSLNVCEIFYK